MTRSFIPVQADRTDPLYIINFGLETHPELAHWGPGTRDCHILHYVLSGEGSFRGVRVTAGEGFYIAPNMFQEYHSSSEAPWQYFWIMLNGPHAEKLIRETVQPGEDGIFSFHFAAKLEQLMASIRLHAPLLNHFEALSMFYSVLQEHTAKQPAEENSLVQSAIAYIDSYFHTNISVAKTAAALHVNDRYLYNLFYRHASISPKQYIDMRRLHAAKELLLKTNASITEIARAVGYDDVCQFSRFFTKHEGISPRKFRARGER